MSRYFTEENFAETVISRLESCPDPRFRQVMESAVRHLHIFVRGDPYIDSDAVFGVKESSIVPFVLEKDGGRAHEAGVSSPLWTAEFDFTLAAAG